MENLEDMKEKIEAMLEHEKAEKKRLDYERDYYMQYTGSIEALERVLRLFGENAPKAQPFEFLVPTNSEKETGHPLPEEQWTRNEEYDKFASQFTGDRMTVMSHMGKSIECGRMRNGKFYVEACLDGTSQGFHEIKLWIANNREELADILKKA